MKKLLAALALLAFVAVLASPAAAESDAEKREALWKSFGAAYRGDVRVYAENPSLTKICFRDGGRTYLFTAPSTVEQVMHAKQVPFVNQITYETRGPNAAFVLWYNGAEQLRVGVDAD